MSDPSPSSTAILVDILDRLRGVMAEERSAISRLDLATLEAITPRKRDLCAELAALRPAALAERDPKLARLVARVRVEIGANAALVAAAGDAIAAALGREEGDRYDRAARIHCDTRPLRVIAI